MKWNELIRRGGAYSRIVLVATSLATVGCLTGCGGDDNGGGGTTTEDSGAGTDTGSGFDSGTGQDTGVQDSGVQDTGTVDSGPVQFVATPTFNPGPGTFTTSPVSVQLATATAGATIRYTTDGTTPNSSSTAYSSAISLSTTTTIKAIAQKAGFADSAIATGTFTINASSGQTQAVQPNPNAGTFVNDQSVALTSETGATICFTLDGSTPTCDAQTATCGGSSQTYNAQAKVPITGNAVAAGTTLTAIACKTGKTNSGPTTALYTFTADGTTSTPASGSTIPYNTNVDVTSRTTGGTIHYTVGTPSAPPTDPTCATTVPAPLPSGGGTIPNLVKDTVIKTIVCKNNYNNSPVTTMTYNVQLAKPTIEPAGGTYDDYFTVNFSDFVPASGVDADTSHGWTCYTRDNTAPTCGATSGCGNGTSVANPGNFLLDASGTVRAVTCRAGNTPSVEATPQTYNLRVTPLKVCAGADCAFATEGTVNPPHTVTGVTISYVTPDIAPSTSGTATGAAPTGAVFCYRNDGTAAACDLANTGNGGCAAGSTAYTGTAFDVTADQPLSVRACKAGMTDSTLSRQYPQAGGVGTPTFTNPPGQYSTQQSVDVSAGNATFFCYTTDGTTTPECAPGGTTCAAGNAVTPAGNGIANDTLGTGSVAGGEVVLAVNPRTLMARGCNPAKTESPVQSGTYTFKVGNPVLTPGAPGPVPAGTTVNFTSSSEVPNSLAFSGAITVQYHFTVGDAITPPAPVTCATGNVGNSFVLAAACNNGGTAAACASANSGSKVNVIACDPLVNFQPSDPVSATYTLSTGTVTFTPNRPGPTFNNAFTVTLGDISPNVTICYTLDGSQPTCNASLVCGSTNGTAQPAGTNGTVVGPITSNTNGFAATTIRAIACQLSSPNSGETTFVGPLNVSPLTFTPPSSAGFSNTETVTIAFAPDAGETATSGATICYSTSGPNTAACNILGNGTVSGCAAGSTAINSGDTVSFATTTDLSAVACKQGYNSSSQNGSYVATPYRHTIDATDGVNDFAAADTFAASGVTAGYVSYDTQNLYLGLQGWSPSSTGYVDFYISGAGATTTPEAGYPGVGGGNLQIGALWHIRYRTDGGDPSATTATVEKWNGSAWVNAGFTINVAVSANTYFETAVSFAQLGITNFSTIQLWGGVATPSTSTRNAYFPSAGTTHYVQLNLNEATAPNDPSNIK